MRMSKVTYYLVIFFLAYMFSFNSYAKVKLKEPKTPSTNTVIYKITGGAGLISTQEVEYVYQEDTENFDRSF